MNLGCWLHRRLPKVWQAGKAGGWRGRFTTWPLRPIRTPYAREPITCESANRADSPPRLQSPRAPLLKTAFPEIPTSVYGIACLCPTT